MMHPTPQDVAQAMAEAAAMATRLMPDSVEDEEGDQMGQMSLPAPRESSHGFTRGPSFDLEYVFRTAAIAAAAKKNADDNAIDMTTTTDAPGTLSRRRPVQPRPNASRSPWEA